MSRPPRFIVKGKSFHGGAIQVQGSELHHMRDVMRLAPGSAVSLLDENGIEYAGRVERFEAEHALVSIIATPRPLPSQATGLVLAPALIKGARMDYLIEKAAELGAAEIWPLLCRRSVVRDPGAERIKRWQRLAKAAAKQSLAPVISEFHSALTVAELVRAMPQETLAIFCAADAEPLSVAIRRMPRPRQILLACGPEGDFDDEEKSSMIKAGFIAAALGSNRLRSETAALAALSIAAGALDELYRGS